jgi:hypothetical protein
VLAKRIAALLKAAPGNCHSVDDLIIDVLAGAGSVTGAAAERLQKDMAKLRAVQNKIRF